MTYFFTPVKIVQVYNASEGYVYDDYKETVSRAGELVVDACAIDYPLSLINTTGHNGKFAGHFNNEDVIAVLAEEIPVTQYEYPWDKSGTFWHGLMRDYRITLPTLAECYNENYLPFKIQPVVCQQILKELQALLPSDTTVAIKVLFEIFHLAANTSNGFVLFH